jgi:hypothetical protein
MPMGSAINVTEMVTIGPIKMNLTLSRSIFLV